MTKELNKLDPKKVWPLLPNFSPIRLTNGVDRYGFSALLAARCGLARTPRSFANWVHGWIWTESPTAELLACAKLPRNLSIIVRNDNEKLSLESEGFKRVHVGGLPFSYVPPQRSNRLTASLLAMPPHSAEAERLTANQSDYMDYLESLKPDFEQIYVSIFSIDFRGPMHHAAKKRGLAVIQGARPDDGNSLLRMRALFDSFEYVTTNVMGSHMLYALYAGCKFSFGGPMYGYDEATLLANGNPHGHSAKRIEAVLWLHSEDYLRSRFEKFFVAHPSQGSQDISLAKTEIGERYLMSPKQVEDVLGWGLQGQVKGFAVGGARRLTRLISGLTG